MQQLYMLMPKYILQFLLISLLYSCATSIKNYNPLKKYPKQQLQEDYSLLRNILEKKHPSLYWYTSKDSMDRYFDGYYNNIEDSMTEVQFGWKILAPLTQKIHCGHTSFGMSKAYNLWADNKKFPSFPLILKCWNDTLAVTGNLNRKDSIFKRGVLITSINGISNAAMIQSLFGRMTEDGISDNVNYLRLSNNFPYYHRNVFGLSKTYKVQYLDSTGTTQTANLSLFEYPKDSTQKAKSKPPVKISRRERRLLLLSEARSLAVDTLNNTAIITLNTFSMGRGLRRFFRQTFSYIKNTGISNLVIDIRSNGGGEINLSTLLTKYVTRVPFKVADTAFAMAKSLRPFTKYARGRFINNLGLFFLTKKGEDGHYHFGLWERKTYHPKKVNNYNGNLYVLINGLTFSASALFCNAIKGQPGVTLLGEETGGGWYGNSGIMIPDITLPHTRLRVRLPLFRLVQYKHVAKDGHGVMPDFHIGTNYAALVKGYDYKMQVVREMIKEKTAVRH